MKLSRTLIKWFMIAVAFAAANLAAVWLIYSMRLPGPPALFLIFGGLPMANLLALVMVVGYRPPRTKPFVSGFETFGWLALFVFAALVEFAPGTLFEHYLWPSLNILPKGQDGTLSQLICVVAVTVAILGLPQIAFAAVGGFLFHASRDHLARLVELTADSAKPKTIEREV
jgi:hypothetical protein